MVSSPGLKEPADATTQAGRIQTLRLVVLAGRAVATVLHAADADREQPMRRIA
jgi:hypothetical protein